MRTLAMVLIFLLGGCSAADVAMYQGTQPQLDLFSYFHGQTRGWGIVQDRQGRVSRQFVVDIDGQVDDSGALRLSEQFHWSDGEKSSRVWLIGRTPDGGLSGTAEDVVGRATGRIAGNALHWKYVLLVAVDGRQWEVALDDWMFLQPDQVLINRTKMSKFGFNLGEVTIVFNKRSEWEEKS